MEARTERVCARSVMRARSFVCHRIRKGMCQMYENVGLNGNAFNNTTRNCCGSIQTYQPNGAIYKIHTTMVIVSSSSSSNNGSVS